MGRVKHSLQEGARALMLRVADDLVWITLFDDVAAVHEDHAIGDISSEGHLVRDDDHRHAVRGESPHDGQDIADNQSVEFLPKPYSLDQINTKVKDVLGKADKE